MPRPFDVRTDSPASVEMIHSAFGSEAYWHARIAEFGGGATTLDTLTVDGDGTISVATTQDLGHDVLPGVLAKVFPRTSYFSLIFGTGPPRSGSAVRSRSRRPGCPVADSARRLSPRPPTGPA